MSVAHWVFFPLYVALKVCTTCRPISLSVGTITFAFLIVIVAIVIAIAGDLKRSRRAWADVIITRSSALRNGSTSLSFGNSDASESGFARASDPSCAHSV